MAQTLSSQVQNKLADPTIANDATVAQTSLFVLRDTVTVPDTADSDTIILLPLPINAVISLLDLSVADLGSAGLVDIGLYRPYADGTFQPVSVDCIASGLDVTTANSNALAPQRFNSLSTDSIDKKLYEIAELTEKPNYPLLYIGLKTTTGTTASGTVSIECSFTL